MIASRRAFLRATGSIAGLGALSGLSGCAYVGLGGGSAGRLRVGTTTFKARESVDPLTGRTVAGLDSVLGRFRLDGERPDVEVIDIDGSSSNAVIAKTQTLLMSEAVDVIQGATLWPYYEQGLLTDLTSYIARDDWKSRYIPAILTPPQERFTYPAFSPHPTSYLSVPADLSVPSLAYDAQLFDDFGVEPLGTVPTIEEILAKAPKLTGRNPRTGKQCYAIGYDPRATAHIMLYYLGRGIDLGAVDPKRPERLTLDTSQVRRGIQGMIDLAPYCPPGFQIGNGRENWGTAGNSVAMNMVVYTADMVAAVQNGLADRFVVTEGVRDVHDHTFLITGTEWAMPAHTEHKDEAWELIKFLSGPAGQRLAFANHLTLPSWKDADWVNERLLPYAPAFLASAAAAHNAFFPEFMFTTFRPWIAKTLAQAISGHEPDLSAGLAGMQRKGEQWARTATPAG